MVNWSIPSPRAWSCSAALAFMVLAGCQTVDPVRVVPSFTTESAFSSHKPTCVALLPIEDATADGSVARLLTHIHQAISRRLPQEPLLYSPTSLHPWVEATMRRVGNVDGSILLPENLQRFAKAQQRPDNSGMEDDCVLAVSIEEWDEKTLMVDHRVNFRFRAAMMAKDGMLLWSGSIQGSVKAGGRGPSPMGRDASARSCAQLAVEQLLLSVPPRIVE